MKKISLWLLTLMVTMGFTLTAGAEAGDIPAGARQSAVGLLTEVFGYTAEEADAFTFRCNEAEGQWKLEFAPKAHPGWQYAAVFDAKTGGFVSGETPFGVPGFGDYPGEATVRDGLRAARGEGWFTDAGETARAAFDAWLTQWGVKPNAVLQLWLEGGGITAAQALNAYFVSCYGEAYQWPVPLKEWRDDELVSYGFTLEAPKAPAQVTRVYTAQSARMGDLPLSIATFGSQAPEELSAAFAVPQLEGWRCLCGIFVTLDRVSAGERFAEWPDRGLLAFEKEGQRLLAAAIRPMDGQTMLIPIGDKALLSTAEPVMSFDVQTVTFGLTYALSENEWERFNVSLDIDEAMPSNALCVLEDYCRVNEQTGESVSLSGRSRTLGQPEGWFYVTTYRNGAVEERAIPRIYPAYLNYIDADRFPRTAEACEAETGFVLPEDYGVTCGVHLRAKTSSHSKDLGLYHQGVLVQVLGTEKGDPYGLVSCPHRQRGGLHERYLFGLSGLGM